MLVHIITYSNYYSFLHHYYILLRNHYFVLLHIISKPLLLIGAGSKIGNITAIIESLLRIIDWATQGYCAKQGDRETGHKAYANSKQP